LIKEFQIANSDELDDDDGGTNASHVINVQTPTTTPIHQHTLHEGMPQSST